MVAIVIKQDAFKMHIFAIIHKDPIFSGGFLHLKVSFFGFNK